jgi:hypothetical protein
MKTALLLLLFVSSNLHWVKQKDSYRVHWLYMNRYGNVLGDYYQPIADAKVTAHCYEGKPVEFSTEQAAREYVLRCPIW